MSPGTVCMLTGAFWPSQRPWPAAGAFAGSDEGSPWLRENVRRLWRFDRDGDHLHGMVISPGDGVASFVHATFDHVTGQGELALVGTHPAHGRKGLAKALCWWPL